jgi:hypothetical protein
MASGNTTTDHEEIRQWVESRGGKPARVKRTGQGDDPGVLRIDFPGFSGEDTLEHIDWDTWFEAFHENNLAFIYQEETADGAESRFNKLVSREAAEEKASGGSQKKSSGSGSKAKSSSGGGSKSSSKSSSSSSSSKSSGGSHSKASASGSKGGSSQKKSSGSKGGSAHKSQHR